MPWEGNTWVPYATPNGTSDFTEAMQYANTVSGDIFGIMLLASIFVVIFVGGSGRNNEDGALAGASFITAIVSILLAAMDVCSDWVAWATVFILLGSMVMLYRGGGGKNV